MRTPKHRAARVVVIGGGISGLSAAHRLIELSSKNAINTEVLLLEGSGRLGGVISTKVKDELILEEGPDSFITTKPRALDLCLRVGLESNILETNDETRRIFVARRDKLVPIPEGFSFAPTRIRPFVMSPLFSLLGKLRMSLDIVLPRRNSKEDESVESFFTRRLGREAFNLLVQPLLSGIYGADPGKLSIRATLPHLAEMEEKHGSIIRAVREFARSKNGASNGSATRRYNQFISLQNGMNEFVEVLASRLPEGGIRLYKSVRKLARNEKGWSVLTKDNESINADGVIVAVPAIHASALVRGFDPQLGDYLSDIKYSSSIVINLIYNRKDFSYPLDGVGFVVPKTENTPITACTFSSVKFPGRTPPETVHLRCVIGGAATSEAHDRDDAWLTDIAHNTLSPLLGITSEPLFGVVSRNPESLPQYAVGHPEHIARIDTRVQHYSGLELAGNAYSGVGIPDCVRSGEEAAERLLNRT